MSQSFLQFGTWTHVLVAGPMKLDAGFTQQFLNVEPSTALQLPCSHLVGPSLAIAQFPLGRIVPRFPTLRQFLSLCPLNFLGFFPLSHLAGSAAASSSSSSMYLGLIPMDFKKPLVAPDKTAFKTLCSSFWRPVFGGWRVWAEWEAWGNECPKDRVWQAPF